MVKYILIIGDGMADNPVESLGGKTPLEYASIPNIDRLAMEGELGSLLTVPRGLTPGSDTAILSIFGCDPTRCYTGRAPLEAAASGMELAEGDAAYRCNMVCLEDAALPFEEKRILSHSAGNIDGRLSNELVTYLTNSAEFKAKAEKAGIAINPGGSFRHIAVQKIGDIESIVLTPPHDHLGEIIGPILPTGCENAETLLELMKTAHEILDKHPANEKRRQSGKMPANGIWFWAEGTAVSLPGFTEHYGKKGGVVSAVPLCHGIASLIGLDMISVEGATGTLHSNLEGKVSAAAEVLKNGGDFVAVHVEAPDECTHDGDLPGKLQAIEWLDSRVVAPLVSELDKEGFEYRILILSDHKTLTSTRGHHGDPVPYIIYDSRGGEGSGLAYSEANGMKGGLIEPGTRIMDRLFEME